MVQNFKHFFHSISILFFLFLTTGCMSRQANNYYETPYSYNDPYYNTPIAPQQSPYKPIFPHYEQRPPLSSEIGLLSENRVKKESAFEKILRQTKTKKKTRKPETKKIKYNDNREEFPSNVPRGSIR